MTATSKDEYLKASRGLATGFGSTVDFADQNVGTTVQSEGGVGANASELPGQVFSVDQLPDPEVARAYGLAPQTIPENLILDDNAEPNIQGKDGLDLVTAELRKELGEPILAFDNTIQSAEDSKLSMTDRTGDNAFKANDDRSDERDSRKVDTDNGRPVDPAGVQKADSGGTPSVPAADGGTANSKSEGKGPKSKGF